MARSHILALLALIVLAVVAMEPARNGGFIYDDEYYVVQNPSVVAEGPIWTAPLGDQSQSLWRPITLLSFRMQWSGPDNAAGFLIVNIALHALAACLVWLLARRWGFGDLAAFASGALFAVHPVHAEAVGWVSGRAELLATVFVLGAWLAHLSSARRASVAAALLIAAAALSKENALAAPALFVVHDLIAGRRPFPWTRHALIALAVAGVVAGRLAILDTFAPTEAPFGDWPLADRVVVAINALALAWWKLLWPSELKVHYHKIELGFSDTVLTAVVVVVTLVTLWALIRGPRRAGIALLLVPVSLITVLNIVPIGATFAERFLYLPSVLACLAIGAFVDAAAKREAPRGLGASLLAVVTLVLIAVPFARSAASTFRDDLTLWAHASQVAPDNPHARYNHGYFLDLAAQNTTHGRHAPGAADELWRSLELDPSHLYAGFAHQVLGVHALSAKDRWLPDNHLAGEHFEQATRRIADHPAGRHLIDPYLNLGSIALADPDAVSPSHARNTLIAFLQRAREAGASIPAEKMVAANELLSQLAR